MADVTITTTTDPITVTVDDSPIQILTDQTPALGGGGGGGFAPDPSAQADDKWLKTTGGAYVFTDAPTGTTNPSDGQPQPVSAAAAQPGVSTAFSRADHVHLGAPTAHNHTGVYSPTSHNHDDAYLAPAEVVAGANVTVDLVTTPGSVIISSAAGGVTDHGQLNAGSLADDDHPQYLTADRGDVRYLRTVESNFTDPGDTHVINDPTNQRVGRWDIEDDLTATAGWPDRLAFRFTPDGGSARTTGYFNEYGELRSQAAKNSTTALRAMGTGASSGRIFDVLNDRGGTEVFGVSASSAFARQQEIVTSPDSTVLRMVALTQAAYDAIGTPDAGTVYWITG